MKKILIFISLLHWIILSNAQYPSPLPSSGPISIQQISNWMRAAGEIGAGTYSLQALKNASHLAVKTAPFKLSDWYAYKTTCIASVAGRLPHPFDVYEGDIVSFSLQYGSLGTGAYWVWSKNDPAGPAIGYGTSLTVYGPPSGGDGDYYYITARGGCNAAIEATASVYVYNSN